MSNLTNLETAALKNIMDSGYGSGETPCVWAFCAAGGIVTERAVGGVVASLAKKGFVVCQGRGDDATIEITAAGAAALKAAV